MKAENNAVRVRYRLTGSMLLLICALLSLAHRAQAQISEAETYEALSADFAHLAPQTIHPASGYIRYPYLIPAGYYSQMWDWDGFFIGLHWANQDSTKATYLRDWVLNFATSADAVGYVAGCITPQGPRPLFGKFAMKPFLAQGALIAAQDLRDYEWLRPVWPNLQRILIYRERTQLDEKWGLWFWDNAMQSGADNNAALSNEPRDRSAIIAVDASVYAMREYAAMAVIAKHLGDAAAAGIYRSRAEATRSAILKKLWYKKDALFFNRNRDTGEPIRVISWSNFLPLLDGLLSQNDGQRAIREHLLNPAEMRSNYGFRSLAKSDPAYNNEAIINPYSNWRGPIWFPTNYLLIEALQVMDFYYGNAVKVEMPTGSGEEMTLEQVAAELERRLLAVFQMGGVGRPSLAGNAKSDWQEHLLFHEYFDGDTGRGLGACHQTGWTALIAKIVQQLYVTSS